jgi:hypothetical protein
MFSPTNGRKKCCWWREDGFDAPPYNNLKSYQAFKRRGSAILDVDADAIETEDNDT